MILLLSFYPVHVCTAGLCVWSRLFVCVYIYICGQKWAVYSVLMLKNLLLCVMSCLLNKFKHLQCGLLHPASCTDREIHAFPKKTWISPGLKIIMISFWALTKHHSLWAGVASCSGTSCVLQQVFQTFSSSCATTATLLFIHVCSGWNFRLSLREM